MGAIYFITFLMILGFLAIPAEPRTFPGDQMAALVIIYERSSSSSGLSLDLSAILSAINNHHEDNDINDHMVIKGSSSSGDKVGAPTPKRVPPSPKPAPPISEFTTSMPASADDDQGGCEHHTNSTDDCISMVTAARVPPPRRRPTPPPAPKPAAPTHPTM